MTQTTVYAEALSFGGSVQLENSIYSTAGASYSTLTNSFQYVGQSWNGSTRMCRPSMQASAT